MKAKLLSLIAFALLCTLPAMSQNSSPSVFNTFKAEVRADFDYFDINHFDYFDINHDDNGFEDDMGGFTGRYFNLKIGGNLTDKFSYYICQRLVANSGSSRFFDNTDFLYLKYKANDNWSFKAGKDALAVGGFEYDAPPIDVLFNTTYWNNFYCFQLGGSASYSTNDGNHTLTAQFTNSPYVYLGASDLGFDAGSEWKSGLFAYSLLWKGELDHFQTLYSVSMFQRPDRGFMNYIALGNKLVYDNWDIYVDFIHHSLSGNDWGKNFGIISCANFKVNEELSVFVKGAYEQNLSHLDIPNYGINGLYDCLIEAGSSHTVYGAGLEYIPSICKDVRIHAYVAHRIQHNTLAMPVEPSRISTLNANVGITWFMDFLDMFGKR